MSRLSIRGLSKSYAGVFAIDSIDLDVQSGQVVGVVGPNGSGKTTLLDALSGLLATDDGAIAIDGAPVNLSKSSPALVHGISRSFQSPRLFEDSTVHDNVLVAIAERGKFRSLRLKPTKSDAQKACALLQSVGLWDKRSLLAKDLSFGQKKVLEIARAFALTTSLVLLDEPFAGLSQTSRDLVESRIKTARENGRSIILVEHNVQAVRELSDEVVVLDTGRIVAKGLPSAILPDKRVARNQRRTRR